MEIPVLDPKSLKDNCEALPVGALGAVSAGGHLNRSFPIAWLKDAPVWASLNPVPKTRLALLLSHSQRQDFEELIGAFVAGARTVPSWVWHYAGSWKAGEWRHGQTLWVDAEALVSLTLGTAPDLRPKRTFTNGALLLLEVLIQVPPILHEAKMRGLVPRKAKKGRTRKIEVQNG